MLKVTHADLESVTKFLDKINNKALKNEIGGSINKDLKESLKLSKMIKDKYTEIKPDYEQ